MAPGIVRKPYKWLSDKSTKSIHRLRSSGSSSSSSSPSSPASPVLTPKRGSSSSKEEELKDVFRHFDRDGDGKISALELRTYFGSIGEYMSHEEAQNVIDDLDADGDGLLDFEDFARLMRREGGGEEEEDDDLRKAFEMFVAKGSVCITPKGLQRMLHRLGDDKSYDECAAMIRAFDVNGDGELDFPEFHLMMA
ncbi:probable calcium-binding protein CML41 [Malania oleifera]|uniref:probable calcium-binding protein CML41 n=1 Tax=Malania oleifera TaxID=397392 RepID=UPI0025AE3F6F|nr:probable calcium-binding protein CML41 [Malania oleifera]